VIKEFRQKAALREAVFHKVQYNATPTSWKHCSRLQQSRSMPLLRIKWPHCWIHCSRDSHCFSTDQTTPNLPLPWPPSNTWFLGPRSAPTRAHDRLSRFCTAQSCPNTQTDRQTMLHAPCVTIQPHLCNACMRCGLIIIIYKLHQITSNYFTNRIIIIIIINKPRTESGTDGRLFAPDVSVNIKVSWPPHSYAVYQVTIFWYNLTVIW